jgi:hypothetical protein
MTNFCKEKTACPAPFIRPFPTGGSRREEALIRELFVFERVGLCWISGGAPVS